MGRAPCCSKVGLHRGAWSSDEDKLLINHIQTHGEGQWRSLPSKAGLLRCGKSCRLRWMNYLRPGIKRGNFTSDENDAIIRLHSLHGSRWSLIATELSGRTDNEIKNHWNAHLRKTVENAGDHQQKTPRNKRSTKKKTEEKTMEVYKHSDSASSSSSSSFLLSDLSSSTIDLEDGDFEFSWLNSWEPCFDGQKDDGFVMDGCDLVKGDENLVFEQLYHEYLNLLNDEDVSESIDELKNKNSVNG